jgi:hypothetical protein
LGGSLADQDIQPDVAPCGILVKKLPDSIPVLQKQNQNTRKKINEKAGVNPTGSNEYTRDKMMTLENTSRVVKVVSAPSSAFISLFSDKRMKSTLC